MQHKIIQDNIDFLLVFNTCFKINIFGGETKTTDVL